MDANAVFAPRLLRSQLTRMPQALYKSPPRGRGRKLLWCRHQEKIWLSVMKLKLRTRNSVSHHLKLPQKLSVEFRQRMYHCSIRICNHCSRYSLHCFNRSINISACLLALEHRAFVVSRSLNMTSAAQQEKWSLVARLTPKAVRWKEALVCFEIHHSRESQVATYCMIHTNSQYDSSTFTLSEYFLSINFISRVEVKEL